MIIGLTVLALTSCNKESKTKDYECSCKINYIDGNFYTNKSTITTTSLDDASNQCKSKAEAFYNEAPQNTTTVDWTVVQK